jgi:hypothetical protein
MTKYVGIFMMLVGIANLGSGTQNGGMHILIGMHLFGFGLAGIGGLGVASVISLPFVGHAIAGWAGAVVGIALVIAAVAYLVKCDQRNFKRIGYLLVADAVIVDRHPPGVTLWRRLETLYSVPSPRRANDESQSAFEARRLENLRFGASNEFDVESVDGKIKTVNGQQCKARLHRVVLYRKPARYLKTLPKQLVELKVKNINATPMAVQAAEFVTCFDQGPFPASLERMKPYRLMDGSVEFGGIRFLRIIDESSESYFYPDSLFRPTSIGRTRTQERV